MQSLFVLAATILIATPAFSVDKQKEKSKAKAAAALALAKAADLDTRAIASGPPVMNDLGKAKERASVQAKPLVLWIDTKPPADTLKAVDVVHCSVKEYPESKDAKCIVFTCRIGGKCDRKASVNVTPSAELLKSMVDDAKKEQPKQPSGTGIASADTEFFISFGSTESAEEADADNEPLPQPEPVKVKRYETRYVQQCINGVCQMVPVNVEVTDEPQQFAVVVKSPVAMADDAPVAASQPIRSFWQNRPRLLGRIFGRLFGGGCQ
jgi:hypothetical protein